MFQSPYIPEWLMSMNDMEMFKFTQSSLVHGENFTDDDIEAYKYTFGQIGAMTPPINYYRNMFSRGPKKPFKLIDTPTLVLWGANDVAFEESLAHSHVDICTDITIK
jgi:pimeloyl-ACP methyl ester carboxylesterase